MPITTLTFGFTMIRPEKYRVAVFPDSSSNSLDILASLRDQKHFEVIGLNSINGTHGEFVYRERWCDLPFVTDEKFRELFIEFVKAQEIHIIIPCQDTVALELANMRHDLSCKVVGSNCFTAEIARHKRKTMEYFRDRPLADKSTIIPTYFPDFRHIGEADYPVFIKPDVGNSARGAYRADRKGDIQTKVLITPEAFCISKFLPGKEVTVDCFTDFDGDLQFVGARYRDRISDGQSVAISPAFDVDNIACDLAIYINNVLPMRGLWFFQMKQDSIGNYKVMEVSVRPAGGHGFWRAYGVNLPAMACYDAMGQETTMPHIDQKLIFRMDRAYINRYKHNLEYSTVYIDQDDTIIKDGTLNPRVMAFLCQERNKGKKVILISKNEYKLDAFGIRRNFFSYIMQALVGGEKYQIMDTSLADGMIFIDDSFAERELVTTHIGCPVFDVDGIEALIDHTH